MQTVKPEIRQRIIDAARKEFMQKGFERSSIRQICALAGTSKSNLYNYFKDKDELYRRILEPTLASIQKGFDSAIGQTALGKSVYTEENQAMNISAVISFIYNNLQDITLLLFKSGGSSLENYKDDVVEKFTDILYKWVKENSPDKNISRFFTRCVCCFYLKGIEQLIINNIPRDQVNKHMNEFVRFIYSGWKGIL